MLLWLRKMEVHLVLLNRLSRHPHSSLQVGSRCLVVGVPHRAGRGGGGHCSNVSAGLLHHQVVSTTHETTGGHTVSKTGAFSLLLRER